MFVDGPVFRFCGLYSKITMKYLIFFTLTILHVHKNVNAVDRMRGVPLSKMSFYKTDSDTFACLDGRGKISITWLNDDYCDCKDGSDEPGTSACPNGSFHCRNMGYKSSDIPSSRVNDGICDCCDGSDEYSGQILCNDECSELGKQYREAEEKRRKLREQGYLVFQEYSKDGTAAVEDSKNQLESLEKEKEELQAKLEELRKAKEDAEAPEKEAKERHQKAWEEEKSKHEAELDSIRSSTAYQELDTDSNGRVSIEEMKTHLEFDISGDGVVGDDEAKEYLEDNEEVELEFFQEKVWPSIKQIYKHPGSEEEPEEAQTPTTPQTPPEPIATPPSEEEEEEEEDYHETDHVNDEDGDDRDFEDEEPEMHDEKKDEQAEGTPSPEDMPEYDDETKALIDAADKAREAFNEVNNRFNDVNKEVESIRKTLESDFGHNNEFYPLKGKCFEFTDREYTYKLCPYDRASQRPKHGGSETSLGTWDSWFGPEDDRYTRQKYSSGQNCWNGPDRSAVVHIHCGLINELTSASEPSRCEYAFDFNTPAACSDQPVAEPKDPHHDEL